MASREDYDMLYFKSKIKTHINLKNRLPEIHKIEEVEEYAPYQEFKWR
jgi:hypothetical protein